MGRGRQADGNDDEGRGHVADQLPHHRGHKEQSSLPTLRSNEEIVSALNISVNTVKQHLKSIHRKLHVGSRRDAVRLARRLGLLPGNGTGRE
ncbi:helix-turn-helix transcriptional regulator [Tessaracoccus terricola]